ncbi:MAG: hypothetical protein HC769_13870 [Cyanobacteria bacterium CRU_2_1]|nr:hypothetical protein [Cyanobacteria bacterium RU_5_0]NJR59825.1 hypothetical protein [Cyanobacteria bacterium CRU_2_1]
MVIHFITLELDRLSSPEELHRSIVAELQKWGDPLRWAITAVDPDRQTVHIEAVITSSSEFLIPAKVTTI